MTALACPACSDDIARWTVHAEPQMRPGPDGEQIAVLAGECRRCGSQVACQPTEEGAASIRRFTESRRQATGRLRATLDGAQAPAEAPRETAKAAP
jgi:hypothetical protein